MKGLKQHIIDFEIVQTGNPKTLVFIDSSDYFTEPERPLLEITMPGYDKYFLVNIIARKVNTFNSNTIGITKFINNGDYVDLPDGAYRFRFKVCPYEFAFKDKVHFRTVQIEQRLSELYTQVDCEGDKSILHDIVEIHALIEGAKLVAQKDIKKANSFYRLASDLIEKSGKCSTC